MHGSGRVRFRGGIGRRGPRSGVTPTGRARSSPRWSPAAAASAYAAIKAAAYGLGMHWTVYLAQALVQPAAWSRLVRVVQSNAVPLIQRECVLAVLNHHKNKVAAMPAGQVQAAAEALARAMRRRAAECPPLESIGVPAAAAMNPITLMGWVDKDLPVGASVRKTPTRESGTGPFGYWSKWHMDRVAASGVVCFARAGDRVRDWRKTSGASDNVPPPIALATALVHTDILPTATAAKQDQYWITGLGRYMAVHEVARAFGLRDESPLTLELCECARPASAVQMLGRAIHAGVALALLRTLDRGGLLPPRVRYASACSGIDTFAEAVDVLRPGAWEYVHAAECDAAPRGVLARAWGLGPDDIYMDAADTAGAAQVDLYIISPDCSKFSRRFHGRDVETVVDGAVDTERVLAFVRARRAEIVVVENVAESDGVSAITTILAGIEGYTWMKQTLSAREHAGAPVTREREFWVGLRGAVVLAAIAV